MPTTLQDANFRVPGKTSATGRRSLSPSEQTGTDPDQYGIVVQRARKILARSQAGLLPKAGTNTAGNTNVNRLDKTIGDLADLVEHTSDPVWKETYRITLLRCLNASEKSKAGLTDAVADGSSDAPETFNHPAVGFDPDLEVSTWSARQAAYQQRFNPPPPAYPPPSLPDDPVANGSEYRWNDIPGLGTTAIPTQTNPQGVWFRGREGRPLGTSSK